MTQVKVSNVWVTGVRERGLDGCSPPSHLQGVPGRQTAHIQ